MDVIEAIHGRRSVRSYDPKPVERDLIENLILDAAQAPHHFAVRFPGLSMLFKASSASQRMVCVQWTTREIIIPTDLVGIGLKDLTSKSFGMRQY
jgi:nitroreductase